MNAPHPFQPGDRVFIGGKASYGFAKYYNRVHCVEKVWIDDYRGKHQHIVTPMFKLIGIEQPVSALGFRLVLRAGGIPV